MNLELYYAPITCAMIPYINLTEAGAKFSVTALDLKAGDQLKSEFLRLNPRHKVPTLLIDGVPLTENVAINLWIGKQFPLARLIPASSANEFESISLMSWFASNVHPWLSMNMAPQRYCSVPRAEENIREHAQAVIGTNFAIVDEMLKGRDWFFDRYTVVDAYFFWLFLRSERFDFEYLDISKFVNCQAHFLRMQERESVRSLLAFEKTVLENFQSHSNSP